MSNDDQLGFLLLDQACDGVDARTHHWRALGGHISTSLHALLSPGAEAGLLLLLALWTVLVQKTEQLGGCLSVKGLVELVDGRRHLQTLQKSSLLALETHVLGPSHKAGQVTLGLDVLA